MEMQEHGIVIINVISVIFNSVSGFFISTSTTDRSVIRVVALMSVAGNPGLDPANPD